MCTTLSCRKSSTATQCTFTKGMGVVEGTTCGAGKVYSNSLFLKFQKQKFNIKL